MWTIEQWYRDAYNEAAANPVHIRDHAALWLRNCTHYTPDLDPAFVERELIKFHKSRLDAVPSFTKYPELRGVRELTAAAWRGGQEGAKLSDAITAARYSGPAFYARYLSSGRLAKLHPKASAGAANCSYVYFPTSEVGPILANNLDSSPEEPFQQPGWPAVSEHLIMGGVSSGVFLDEESPEIFPAPVHQLVGRYARNAKEAVEILERYNYFWGPGNMIVIDRDSNVAMIEKTTCRIGVRWSTDGFGYITAMTQHDPEIRKYVHQKRAESLPARGLKAPCADTVYWAAQDKRRDLMQELLDEAKKKPSVEALRSIIQFRDPKRGNVAGNGEPLIAEGPPSEWTLKTSLWELAKGRARWWARDNATGKPSFENRMPDVEFKDVWLWN